MLKGSGSGLSNETSWVDLSLISNSGTLPFEDDAEAERIIAWNTVSERARLRLSLRMDVDSEDFEEHLSEMMEGVREDSVGVDGSCVSTGWKRAEDWPAEVERCVERGGRVVELIHGGEEINLVSWGLGV